MVDVRSRRTKHLNRARVRLELVRGLRPAAWVAGFLALGIALFGFVVLRVAPEKLRSTYEVRVAVENATGVQPGLNPVELKGIPIGKIESVDFAGEQAVLRLEIESRYGRLYRDATAELKPNTALMDMVLDITDRGHPQAGTLKSDVPLPAVQTQMPVNVSDVLNIFQPSQRVHFRTLLAELGNGMRDRGRSLRALFVQLAPFVQEAGLMARQLADRRPQVRRLVHNMALLTGELGRRDAALRTLVREGSRTLGTLQSGSSDLDATMRELPGALSAIDSSFAATRGVLDDVDGALRALRPVAGELPTSLAALRALGVDLAPAVRALQRPVDRLVPLARILRPLAGNLDAAVSRLAPQARTFDKVTRDLANCKKGVQGFFQWNVSMAKFGDARGPVPRGNVVYGAQSSSLFNDPNEVAPQACTPGQVIGGRVPGPKDKH